ncbi:MAG: hypothetical protein WAN71_06840 [Mycobacterium sp.]|uniref:hypothetical protein n=1 Tax=Mycobacterium sp. TaxID=1785 RepID=UPI003BAE29C7
MSRNDRTLTPRGRRLAFSFGTAAGAAVIAASISMGTAPVASAIGDADPLSDLVGALDPSAFNILGLPDDALGLLASGLDADLLAPLGLGALLDPVIDDLVGSGGFFGIGSASVFDVDPLSDLVGALDPSAFNILGLPTDALGLLASGLDADLLAPLGLGALLDPVIDDLVGSGFTLF